MLVLARPQHQVANGLARVLALFQDQLHLLGNRHLHAMLPRQSQGGTA